MKVDICTDIMRPLESARVGNVYAMRGGRAARYGHMMILIAIGKPVETYNGSSALMMIINKDGDPVGVTSYGMHYIEELCPIAFVDGLEEMSLTMRSL